MTYCVMRGNKGGIRKISKWPRLWNDRLRNRFEPARIHKSHALRGLWSIQHGRLWRQMAYISSVSVYVWTSPQGSNSVLKEHQYWHLGLGTISCIWATPPRFLLGQVLTRTNNHIIGRLSAVVGESWEWKSWIPYWLRC